MTEQERAEVASYHPEGGRGAPGTPQCGGCHGKWPCETVRLLDALEQAEREIAGFTKQAFTHINEAHEQCMVDKCMANFLNKEWQNANQKREQLEVELEQAERERDELRQHLGLTEAASEQWEDNAKWIDFKHDESLKREQRLREALEFYANEAHYNQTVQGIVTFKEKILMDYGEKAQQALTDDTKGKES